jgi:hypothetical protein
MGAWTRRVFFRAALSLVRKSAEIELFSLIPFFGDFTIDYLTFYIILLYNSIVFWRKFIILIPEKFIKCFSVLLDIYFFYIYNCTKFEWMQEACQIS